MPETELLPVYLITGGDLPKIAFALGRLRSRFAEGSVDHRFAESSTGEDVVQALNALGLFGGGERLVVVEAIERWKKADADVVALYLESPTPGAVLALVGDASKLEALVTSSGKAGEVLNYDLPKKKVRGRETDDFPRWVQGRFERAGVRVDRDVAERLVEIVHEDTLALENEIAKIVTWAGGDQIGEAEIERLATPGDEGRNYRLVNAWGARDVGAVLAACEIDLRGEPEPFWIAAQVANHVTRVRAVQALLRDGVRMQDITSRLGLRFPPRREAAVADLYSEDELGKAIVRIAALDKSLKGGSRLDPVLELERALVEITVP